MIHSNLYIDMSGSISRFAASDSARAQSHPVIRSINLAVNRDQAIDQASCALRSAQPNLFFEPAPGAYDVVILAGDIDVRSRGVKWANETFKGPVIYVCGTQVKKTGFDPGFVIDLP